MTSAARRLGLSLAALLSLALPAAAQDFRRGLSAYNIGDYAETLRQWRPLAEQDDPAAEAGLGYLYLKGLGVGQDFAEAARWFGRAAEQGQPEAQLFLGLLHYDGSGVPRSYVLAYKWCDLAQTNGAPAASSCREAAALRMTEDQLAESTLLVEQWYARHSSGAPSPDAPSRRSCCTGRAVPNSE
jgi:uncharacterized protein